MQCRQFNLAMEEHLAQHPDQQSGALPQRLMQHAVQCRECYRAMQCGVRSRALLASLRGGAAQSANPAAKEDIPVFLTRLHGRIQEEERRRERGWRNFRVAWKEWAAAAVLFACTLGSFVYNIQRTERPNIDEAMALDVPHLNPQHPSDDHLRPRNSDVLVSLFNP